jgi:hypothetical protein
MTEKTTFRSSIILERVLIFSSQAKMSQNLHQRVTKNGV